MATIAITNAGVCDGGGHAHMTVQVDARPSRSVAYLTDELRGNPSADEVRMAVGILLQLHMASMTRAQAVAALAGGITITTRAA